MSTKAQPNKKRKLNTNSMEEKCTNESQSIAELILGSQIQDIFGNTCMTIDKLDQLSKKLALLQNETKQRLMNAISFDTMDGSNLTLSRNLLQKCITCTKSNIENGDSQCDLDSNYFHVTSFGTFEIGPNKTKLQFDCQIGDEEGAKDGEVSFGDLWSVEMHGYGGKVNVYLDGIKKLVTESGIKGIGVGGNDNYGYYSFAFDLTQICLDMIGDWSGDFEPDRLMMSDLYNTLEEGDI